MLSGFKVMASAGAALTFVKTAIKSHNVVVFSKTTCPFSILAKKILSEVGVEEMQVYEIERRQDGRDIQVRTSQFNTAVHAVTSDTSFECNVGAPEEREAAGFKRETRGRSERTGGGGGGGGGGVVVSVVLSSKLTNITTKIGYLSSTVKECKNFSWNLNAFTFISISYQESF